MKAMISRDWVNWGPTGFLRRKGWRLCSLLRELTQPVLVLFDKMS